MLGRLARYLRFVGCDTAYARGLGDDEVLGWAEREGRVLLTRDRLLSQRAKGALRLFSPSIAEQWRELRTAWPSVPTEPRFERCTLCNGSLRPADVGGAAPSDPGVPAGVLARGVAIYRCVACRHAYWDGSHTARIRAQLALWERGSPV